MCPHILALIAIVREFKAISGLKCVLIRKPWFLQLVGEVAMVTMVGLNNYHLFVALYLAHCVSYGIA